MALVLEKDNGGKMCVKSIIGRVKWNGNSAWLKTHQDAFKKLNSNFQPVSLIQKPALITQVKNLHSVLCPIHMYHQECEHNRFSVLLTIKNHK